MIAYCFCFHGTPDWEAIGAIGQVAGAIATFLAVVVALRVRKAKLKIKLVELFAKDSSDDRIQVHVVNDSEITVKLDSFIFRVGMEQKNWVLTNKVEGLPFVLEPHLDKIFSIAHEDIATTIMEELQGTQNLALFIQDAKGKQHPVKPFSLNIEKYVQRMMM